MKHIITLFFALIFASCTDTLIGDEGRQDEDIYLNYRTKTDLELPFEGDWRISAGGRTHLEGAHHFITRGSGQRYAYDIFKVVDGNGNSGNTNGNNGWGNGDQDAPGGSCENNNAENGNCTNG